MTVASDCELIRPGLLDQPVNALSSLVFVAVALWLRHRPVLAVLAIATGLGSFVYHGFAGAFGEWAHDTSLLVLVLGITYEARPRLLVAAALVAGIALWALPSIAEVVTVAVTVGAAATLAHRGELSSPRAIGAIVVLGAGAAVNGLSRTGEAWCVPNSVVQGHGIWHIAAAVALCLWGQVPRGDRPAAGAGHRSAGLPHS